MVNSLQGCSYPEMAWIMIIKFDKYYFHGVLHPINKTFNQSTCAASKTISQHLQFPTNLLDFLGLPEDSILLTVAWVCACIPISGMNE